jgi:hypothetical protein
VCQSLEDGLSQVCLCTTEAFVVAFSHLDFVLLSDCAFGQAKRLEDRDPASDFTLNAEHVHPLDWVWLLHRARCLDLSQDDELLGHEAVAKSVTSTGNPQVSVGLGWTD